MDASEAGGGERRHIDRSETRSESEPLAFGDRDSDDFDGATELYLLDRYADGDGTVRVQLLGWERDGDRVRVDYALPTGERLRDRYRWPTAGRYDESDFLALVRGLGYPPGAADLVAGEFARARNENGRWRLVTGRRSRDGRDAAKDDAGDATGSDAADAIGRSGLRGRVRRAGPMGTGSAAVALLILAVGVPASVATATGGLTTAATALGGGLFVAALATLGLAIASTA